MSRDYRATRDQAVIDAWAAQLARRRQAFGRMAWALAGSVALLAAYLLLQPGVVGTILAIFAGAAIWGRLVGQHQELRCPHCGRIPRTWIEGGSPMRVARAEYCPHCFYWLRPPPY